MKAIILFIGILFTSLVVTNNSCIAQSKKEQIAQLRSDNDSLNILLNNIKSDLLILKSVYDSTNLNFDNKNKEIDSLNQINNKLKITLDSINKNYDSLLITVNSLLNEDNGVARYDFDDGGYREILYYGKNFLSEYLFTIGYLEGGSNPIYFNEYKCFDLQNNTEIIINDLIRQNNICSFEKLIEIEYQKADRRNDYYPGMSYTIAIDHDSLLFCFMENMGEGGGNFPEFLSIPFSKIKHLMYDNELTRRILND